MSIQKSLEVKFTCDHCGRDAFQVYPTIKEGLESEIVYPTDWVKFTIDGKSNDYCSSCSNIMERLNTIFTIKKTNK